MPVEVQLFDDLDAVARDAAGALDRDNQASLFDRLDWFRLTLAHCPAPGRPLIACARDGAGATAWLFLTIANRRTEAMASWYTLAFDTPSHPQNIPADACLHAIAAALAGAGIDRITLAPLAEEAAHRLAAILARGKWASRLTQVSVNWSIAITAPDWPAFLAARPGPLRTTLRRRGRGDPFAIAIHTRFDAAAWGAYEAVYRASWKPAEGSPAFLRALAEREGAAGTLRLGIARAADGSPVAAQLWLTEHGIATIHKLAYVQAAKAGSPGTLLSAAMFRHAIEADRVRRIDFGAGDDAYKADWMDHPAPLYRLDAYRRASPRALVALARATAAALVRARRRG